MVTKLLIAWLLTAVCVAIHAWGLTFAFVRIRRWAENSRDKVWASMWVLTATAAWTLCLHIVAIVIWGVWYVQSGALPDYPTAFYFSAATYTTTGYGDVTLPAPWHFASGAEALSGILLCGLTASFFFAVFLRLFSRSEGTGAPGVMGSGAPTVNDR